MSKPKQSPLSKAEHEFLESEPTILNSRTLISLFNNYEASDEYLKNRIRTAFLAGWNACEKEQAKKILVVLRDIKRLLEKKP